MAPAASRIPCYYCKDETTLYDSRSFTAHILESHRDRVVVRDPVDFIFGDSFGLTSLLFREDREDVDPLVIFGESLGLTTLFDEDEDDADDVDDQDDADPEAASVGPIACNWCPKTFPDLSSSTNHLRILHPDLFYPLCAHAAFSASAAPPAPAESSAASAVVSSASAVVSSAASASASASAEADDDYAEFLRFP